MEEFEMKFAEKFADGKAMIVGFTVDELFDLRHYLEVTDQTPKELLEKGFRCGAMA